MNRTYYDELCGTKRVTVKLSAVYHAIDALESGDIQTALTMLKTLAAVEDRAQLRTVRNELWKRYKHAQQVGDDNEVKSIMALIAQVDAARASLTA